MKLVDSSCIICVFDEINRPYILMDWLKRNYQIVITEQVYGELQENPKTKEIVNPEIKKGKITVKNIVTQDECDSFKNRYPTLGMGEISIIQTALKLNKQGEKYYAVLDDGRARKVASKLGVKLTGTYGLLKSLNEKGCIDKENFELCKKAMGSSSFRINFDMVK